MKKFPLGFLVVCMTLNSGCDYFKETKNGSVADNFLDCVDYQNEIKLSHADDRYGEWGGDTDLILIYSDGNEIYAKYSRYLGSVNPPPPPKENEGPIIGYEHLKLEFTIDSIKLDYSDRELIEKTIFELLKSRLRNSTALSHSGVYNYVVSKDSSLMVLDYPSIKWENFQKLKAKLVNRNAI
jgi:hypothetical protein